MNEGEVVTLLLLWDEDAVCDDVAQMQDSLWLSIFCLYIYMS